MSKYKNALDNLMGWLEKENATNPIFVNAKQELAALRDQRNDYMDWHTQQGREIARLWAELSDKEKMIYQLHHNVVGAEMERDEQRAELQRVKDLAKRAQEKLQATQYNWREECLFECNELLDEINPQPFTSPDPTPITKDEIMAGG